MILKQDYKKSDTIKERKPMKLSLCRKKSSSAIRVHIFLVLAAQVKNYVPRSTGKVEIIGV